MERREFILAATAAGLPVACDTGSVPGTSSNVREPRGVAARTRGSKHGPITRLVSPGDLGEHLKPFVFLDHFEMLSGSPVSFGWHPHSGIATVTYIFEGTGSYEETNGSRGTLPTGSIEWMRASGGVWHTGGANAPIRPPAGHTVAWLAVHRGELSVSARPQDLPSVTKPELVVFERGGLPVTVEAKLDTDFVVGSAVPHPHALVTGRYSVHTSRDALRLGEANIARIGKDLRAAGLISG